MVYKIFPVLGALLGLPSTEVETDSHQAFLCHGRETETGVKE